MMKELHKLITKDIFDCLSEEDAGRLRELRAELHIDDEAYRQMKKMITSREVHDRIMEVRKKPSRMIKMMRYAAILILPVAIAAYIFISQGNVIKPEIVVQNQVEEKLPVPVRKQAMLVLEDGSILQLQRVEGKKEVTSNAITNGNELVYSKKDSSENNVVVEYNTVVVPKGGEYHVMLADGTKVWFNEETQLRFPVDFVGDSREVFLSKGEIYLEVARDEKHPFIVHTENGDIQVLGTEFNVKCLPDKKVGTVMLGERVLVPGDVLTAEQAAQMTFSPRLTELDESAEVGYLPIYPDGVEASAAMTIGIRGKENKPPVAEDSALETYKNLAADGKLKVADPEGEDMVYAIVRRPKRGTVTSTTSKRIKFSASSG